MPSKKESRGFWQVVMVVLAMMPLLLMGAGTPFGPLSNDVRTEALERQNAVLVGLGLRQSPEEKFGQPYMAYMDCQF